jgi:hypothetical protein
LAGIGYRHLSRRDYDAALRCFRLEQAVAEKIGDRAGVAGAWMNFGLIEVAQDDYEQSLVFHQKALVVYEAAGLKPHLASRTTPTRQSPRLSL